MFSGLRSHKDVRRSSPRRPQRPTQRRRQEGGTVNLESKTDRRSFLGGMAGVAAAASLPVLSARVAAAAEGCQDDWLKEVKGAHKCLFDFPQHKNFFPLLHILNYIDTYSKAYK